MEAVIKHKKLNIGLAGAFFASLALELGVGPAQGAATSPEETPPTASTELTAAFEEQLTEAFEVIESIPDEAFESQETFEAWQSRQNVVELRGPVDYGISVTVALASNVFAVAEIAKIRSAIEAAGGAQQFATKAIGAFNYAKNTRGMSNSQVLSYAAEAGGEDVVNALVDFLALRGVAEDCFGVQLRPPKPQKANQNVCSHGACFL